MSIDQWIAAAAAIGQVAAALLALAALMSSLRTARAQTEMSGRLAGEHSALLFEQVRMQRDSDVLRWTEKCIEALSEADTFIGGLGVEPFGDIDKLRHASILTRLSALIDQGRMYFPNQAPESQGADKPAAYQGFRQRILSVLVRAYDEISKAPSARGANDARMRMERLMVLRRLFVSEAQIAIDPRRFIALKEMNDLRVGRGLAADQPTQPEGSGPSPANGLPNGAPVTDVAAKLAPKSVAAG